MVEHGADDLVARLELVAERAGQREGQRGHILPEDDLVGTSGVQQIRHSAVGCLDHGIRST
jgi:hypothetical protein